MNKDFDKKAVKDQIRADRDAYRNGPKIAKGPKEEIKPDIVKPKVVKKKVVKKEEIS